MAGKSLDRSVPALEKATREFFRKHWDSASGQPPAWSDPWRLVGNLPNGERQGVYALLKKGEVIYVGVGASRNGGLYSGAGIGARFWAYMRWDKSIPVNQNGEKTYTWKGKWAGVAPEEALTLGFEPGTGYLACALEPFLIRELDPAYNRVKVGQVDK